MNHETHETHKTNVKNMAGLLMKQPHHSFRLENGILASLFVSFRVFRGYHSVFGFNGK
jgi:hypothetical protein